MLDSFTFYTIHIDFLKLIKDCKLKGYIHDGLAILCQHLRIPFMRYIDIFVEFVAEENEFGDEEENALDEIRKYKDKIKNYAKIVFDKKRNNVKKFLDKVDKQKDKFWKAWGRRILEVVSNLNSIWSIDEEREEYDYEATPIADLFEITMCDGYYSDFVINNVSENAGNFGIYDGEPLIFCNKDNENVVLDILNSIEMRRGSLYNLSKLFIDYIDYFEENEGKKE